jgi:hypothetical protein
VVGVEVVATAGVEASVVAVVGVVTAVAIVVVDEGADRVMTRSMAILSSTLFLHSPGITRAAVRRLLA